MKNSEFVSRVNNELRLLNKDEYISDRYILRSGNVVARQIITQRIKERSLNRNAFLYRQVDCIEFEPINTVECPHIEFKLCKELSKSVKKFSDLIYTRYGSSIKELYSIDGQYNFTESTLYQLRNDSQRAGSFYSNSKFYMLNDYIYIPEKIKTLSGRILMPDQYELDLISNCGGEINCESIWDKDFICPDSHLNDVINYTIQRVTIPKQIPEDEKANLNSNDK